MQCRDIAIGFSENRSLRFKFMRSTIFTAVVIFTAAAGVLAQTGAGGGISTGEAKTYASKRTTGIVDKTAPRIFENITAATALSSFTCTSGGKEKEYILETTSCAVAVFDYNNDGRPDIFLVNGSTIELEKEGKPAPRAALFKNLGGWKFEDVTEKAGLANERWGMGAATGDFNNDGFIDLFVGNYGKSRLYKNNGDGTFTDVAEKLGVKLDGWHNGASFGDFNRDGRLDLFVPSYLDFPLDSLPPSPLSVKDKKGGNNFCQFRGEPVMCGPRGLKGGKDKLFVQNKDGSFTESGDELGVKDEGNYYGFSSVFVDIDDDRDLDILVVNDSTPKQVYVNEGGKFEEFGYPSGLALNENGREQAGMGLGVGDFDNDLRVDFHITNFSDDSNTLYRNDGDGNFTDITFQAGLGEASIPFLGWGTSFLDFDNDGWKDVVVGNGHVYPLVDNFQWGTSFAQQMLLFRNQGTDGKTRVKFENIGAAPDSALAESHMVRGLAVADFDGDGYLDIVTNNMDASPSLLKNVGPRTNNWLRIKLAGGGISPKDAVGAVVIIKSGESSQRFDLISGAGYASQNEQVVHFGLGTVKKIDEIKVLWPDGATEIVKTDKINTIIKIEQGKGVVAE
jgi:hypothetical protein